MSDSFDSGIVSRIDQAIAEFNGPKSEMKKDTDLKEVILR